MSRRTAESNKAIREAWKREQSLVQEGKGTRDWTTEQQQDILDKGKAYDDDGKAFEGQHMKSAEHYPEYQGDPDNIQFLTRSEHFDAHRGNWQNPTNGYYDPSTGVLTEFREDELIPCPVNELSNPLNRDYEWEREQDDDLGLFDDDEEPEEENEEELDEERGLFDDPEDERDTGPENERDKEPEEAEDRGIFDDNEDNQEPENEPDKAEERGLFDDYEDEQEPEPEYEQYHESEDDQYQEREPEPETVEQSSPGLFDDDYQEETPAAGGFGSEYQDQSYDSNQDSDDYLQTYDNSYQESSYQDTGDNQPSYDNSYQESSYQNTNEYEQSYDNSYQESSYQNTNDNQPSYTDNYQNDYAQHSDAYHESYNDNYNNQNNYSQNTNDYEQNYSNNYQDNSAQNSNNYQQSNSGSNYQDSNAQNSNSYQNSYDNNSYQNGSSHSSSSYQGSYDSYQQQSSSQNSYNNSSYQDTNSYQQSNNNSNYQNSSAQSSNNYNQAYDSYQNNSYQQQNSYNNSNYQNNSAQNSSNYQQQSSSQNNYNNSNYQNNSAQNSNSYQQSYSGNSSQQSSSHESHELSKSAAGVGAAGGMALASNAAISRGYNDIRREVSDDLGISKAVNDNYFAQGVKESMGTFQAIDALTSFGGNHAAQRTGRSVSRELSSVQISDGMNGQQLVSQIMEDKGFGKLDFSNAKSSINSLGLEEGKPSGYYGLLKDYRIVEGVQIGNHSMEIGRNANYEFARPSSFIGRQYERIDARINGETLNYETVLDHASKKLIVDAKKMGIELSDAKAKSLASAMIGTGGGVAATKKQIKVNNTSVVRFFKGQIRKCTKDDITANAIRQEIRIAKGAVAAKDAFMNVRNISLTKKQRRLNLRLNRMDRRLERLTSKYGNIASGYISDPRDARLVMRLQRNKLATQDRLKIVNRQSIATKRYLGRERFPIRFRKTIKTVTRNSLKTIKLSKPGRMVGLRLKKTKRALKKAIPSPLKRGIGKLTPVGRVAGKVIGAPIRIIKATTDITQFIMGEIKRLLFKFLMKFIGVFSSVIMWIVVIFFMLTMVEMAFMLVATFFSTEEDVFDPQKVEEATMGKVYYELSTEEIKWARNLKKMMEDDKKDTTKHGVLINDLEYSYYDETSGDGHYVKYNDVLLRNVDAETYIPPALGRPYDADIKAVKGPIPWPNAPEEAFKWIKVIDGGIELQFRGGDGVPGYTSNVQCIVCCVTTVGQQFDNTEDWKDGEKQATGIKGFLDGIASFFKDIANFFKNAGSWIVNKISEAIPAIGAWATDHAAEVRASVYMGYCKPLFDASHQTEYSLKLSIYPTPKTLSSFLASGKYERSGSSPEPVGVDEGGGDDMVDIPAIGESDTSKGAIAYSQADLDAMIRTVVGEAGNQGKAGMMTVAEVIYNRAISNRFPNSVQAVCTARNQFLGYWRFANTPISVLKGKYSGCEQACKEVLSGKKSVLNNTNIIGFKSDRGPAMWNGWARYNEDKIYGHYFYYLVDNSTDVKRVKASTKYTNANTPEGSTAVTDIIMCTGFESQKDIDADAKAGTDIKVEDEHEGYGCMSYSKFMMKYDDYNNLYYDANGNGEPDADEKVEEAMPANLIGSDSLFGKDACIAPGNDVEELVHAFENHSDCWSVSGGGDSDYTTMEPNYNKSDLGNIPSSAGSKDQYYISSSDGGKTYEVWGVTDSREVAITNPDGTPGSYTEYKYTKYTFTHKCKSDHKGYYCGGHLKLVVTGVILGFTRAQISNNHTLYEGKTEAFQLTDDEISYDKEKLKKALDIFDCDLAITHKTYCINQDFEGWNMDNIDWAVAESADDWAANYGIYVSYTLGGNTADSGYNTGINEVDGEKEGTGSGYTGAALSGTAIKDILDQLEVKYGSDPTWPIRKEKVKYALSFVGNLGYSQEWHTRALKYGGKSDCSGFASGVWIDKIGKVYDTSSFFNVFRPQIKKWDGNAKPGDILLHYVGAVDNTDDHALVYIGNIDGKDMSVDCTTVNDIGVTRYTHRNYYSECYYIDMDSFCK